MRTRSPDVSLVIAAFNSERSIAQSVMSALAQHGVAIEIIVVDDCSTDGTMAVAQTIARSDPRVLVLLRTRNGGCGPARNTGLRAARGRYVAMLDADDTIHPWRMARLMNAAERWGADLVADNQRLLEAGSDRFLGLAFPDDWLGSSPVSVAQFVARDQFHSHANKGFAFIKPLVRRSFLEQHDICFDPVLRIAEDFLFGVECLVKGAQLRTIDQPLYEYRVRSGEAHKRAQNYIDQAEVNERARALCDPNDRALMKLFDTRYSYIHFAGLQWALKSGDVRAAAYFARRLPRTYLMQRVGLAARRRLGLAHQPA